jgi:hypothetical protein
MTTPPPAPSPAPAPVPAPAPTGPPKKSSSGTVALVFGIILCFLGFVYAGSRFLLLVVASILRADAYTLGQAIGALFVVALFGVPGILLIRRSNRARRANKEAIAAAIWELEYDAQHANDVPPSAHTAGQTSGQAAPAYGPTPPAAAPTTSGPSTASAPPVPPYAPAPPIPPVPPIAPPA